MRACLAWCVPLLQGIVLLPLAWFDPACDGSASLHLPSTFLLVLALQFRLRQQEHWNRMNMLRRHTFVELHQQETMEKVRRVHEESRLLGKERDLSATAWHELKNPLNCLVGCIRLMQTEFAAEGVSASSNVAKCESAFFITANSCLEHALDCLSSFATTEQQRSTLGPVAPEPTELVELLRRTGEMVAPQLARGGGSVALALKLPKERLWVMADGKMVRQVVLNLLSNAVRLTEAGFVLLRCKVLD